MQLEIETGSKSGADPPPKLFVRADDEVPFRLPSRRGFLIPRLVCDTTRRGDSRDMFQYQKRAVWVAWAQYSTNFLWADSVIFISPRRLSISLILK